MLSAEKVQNNVKVELIKNIERRAFPPPQLTSIEPLSTPGSFLLCITTLLHKIRT